MSLFSRCAAGMPLALLLVCTLTSQVTLAQDPATYSIEEVQSVIDELFGGGGSLGIVCQEVPEDATAEQIADLLLLGVVPCGNNPPKKDCDESPSGDQCKVKCSANGVSCEETRACQGNENFPAKGDVKCWKESTATGKYQKCCVKAKPGEPEVGGCKPGDDNKPIVLCDQRTGGPTIPKIPKIPKVPKFPGLNN